MTILKQCCCGCRLAQGAQIIGWIALVLEVLGIISLGMQINSKGSVQSYSSKSYYDDDFRQYTSSSSSASSSSTDFADVASYGTAVHVVLIVFRIITLISAICLIIGATKLNKHLLLPYLILQGITLALYTIFLFIILIAVRSLAVFVVFLIYAAGLALGVYLYLVIVSLYQEITENEGRSQPVAMQPMPGNVNIYQPAGGQYPSNTPYSNTTTVPIYPNLNNPEQDKFIPAKH